MLAWLGNTSRGCHFPSSNSLRAKKIKNLYWEFSTSKMKVQGSKKEKN